MPGQFGLEDSKSNPELGGALMCPTMPQSNYMEQIVKPEGRKRGREVDACNGPVADVTRDCHGPQSEVVQRQGQVLAMVLLQRGRFAM